MLSSVKEFVDVLVLILVRDGIAEALVNASLIVLFNHLWPKDTSVGHVCTCLNIENGSDTSFLESQDVVKTQRIGSDQETGVFESVEVESTHDIAIELFNSSIDDKDFVRVIPSIELVKTNLASIIFWVL